MNQEPDTTYHKKSITYALIIIVAWFIIHVFSVFMHSLSNPLWQTLILILLQSWLYAGIFIVAHDAMHGTLYPKNIKLNDSIGRFIVFIYAGFDWKKMRASHHAHHVHSGTIKDPDY